NTSDCAAPSGICPLAIPHATRQWLTGINRTCPPEHLGKQLCDTFLLVGPLDAGVHTRGIVWFIPQVPTQNAIIVAALVQYSGHLVVQSVGVAGVVDAFSARALHPTRVVDPRPRRALSAQSGQRVPTGVEQDKQWFDTMPRRDADKLRET